MELICIRCPAQRNQRFIAQVGNQNLLKAMQTYRIAHIPFLHSQIPAQMKSIAKCLLASAELRLRMERKHLASILFFPHVFPASTTSATVKIIFNDYRTLLLKKLILLLFRTVFCRKYFMDIFLLSSAKNSGNCSSFGWFHLWKLFALEPSEISLSANLLFCHQSHKQPHTMPASHFESPFQLKCADENIAQFCKWGQQPPARASNKELRCNNILNHHSCLFGVRESQVRVDEYKNLKIQAAHGMLQLKCTGQSDDGTTDPGPPAALIKTSARPFIILVSFSIPDFPWLPGYLHAIMQFPKANHVCIPHPTAHKYMGACSATTVGFELPPACSIKPTRVG
ncbi:hypothetical protein EK904_012031 [Melospiza melodia maxima]|nr:hypothetical protein EK904_012031 [Melospiza melodia maxima]